MNPRLPFHLGYPNQGNRLRKTRSDLGGNRREQLTADTQSKQERRVATFVGATSRGLSYRKEYYFRNSLGDIPVDSHLRHHDLKNSTNTVRSGSLFKISSCQHLVMSACQLFRVSAFKETPEMAIQQHHPLIFSIPPRQNHRLLRSQGPRPR